MNDSKDGGAETVMVEVVVEVELMPEAELEVGLVVDFDCCHGPQVWPGSVECVVVLVDGTCPSLSVPVTSLRGR